MFTKTEFTKKVESAISAGQKARDLFQLIAVDAVEFFHVDGPSRNDVGRIQLVLKASESVQMVNTAALAMFFVEFCPVSIDDEFNVKYNKVKAKECTEDKRLAAVELAKATPFWTFRKHTEKKPSQFDAGHYAENAVAKLVKDGGLSQEQIIELVRAAFETDRVVKLVSDATKNEIAHIQALVGEADQPAGGGSE